MIEIIPNWHPLLVHFTVGQLTTLVLFYLASAILSHTNSWKQQWLNMANWSLWSGCLFAIATAIAGWLAYNSVAHDSASHAAMTLHRNWALPTASTAASHGERTRRLVVPRRRRAVVLSES